MSDRTKVSKEDLVNLSRFGTGFQLSGSLTDSHIRKASRLDWEVLRSPLETTVGEKRIVVPSHDVLLRSDNHQLLTVAPTKWHHLENSVAWDYIEQFVKRGDLEYDSAGQFKKGAVIWVLCRIKNSFSLFGKDVVEPYLLFTISHKYGMSIDIRVTSIRVSCWNSLVLALAGEAPIGVRLSHREKFDPEQVSNVLGFATEKFDGYKDIAEFLASKRFTRGEVENYFDTIWPSKGADNDNEHSKNAQICLDSLDTQPGHEFGAGTWWSAYNAATYNIDHVFGRGAETRTYSALYGQNHTRKTDALDEAILRAQAA